MSSATPTTLRDATPEDAAAIAEIYNQSIGAGDATMDEELWSAGRVRRKLAAFGRRETILVLQSGQMVAGWGIIKKYSDRRGYRFCCETAVYLRRDLVSRGFGTRLKRALIERCRRYGYHHLVARIFADNRASIEYNKKLGYEVVGTQKEIGFRNGRWQDVTILQLVLDDVRPPEPPRKIP
ncbi:MAG: N-acetyltransferase family protein [Thermoanaerobaculia bacterium]